MSKTGYIYKLVCNDVEIKECYVGGTINFRHRKWDHKKVCNKDIYQNHNLCVYQFIRENGGWENWCMVQIEEFKHNTKRELNARERYWIETLQATLNTNIPTRTMKEYNNENQDKIAEKAKKRYEDNKEDRLKKNKEWREKNKEDLLKKGNEYRQKNKEIIADRKKFKMTCECGTTCRKNDIKRHEKSQKHKDYIISVHHTVS